MSSLTKAANAHTVVATGWTNPSNAYATSADGTNFATIATAKNATYSGDFGFPAFTTTEIPDHSTLTSVVVNVNYGLTATATGALVGVQSRRNTGGVTLGSEITRTAASRAEATQAATGATLADLRTANEFRARARATKGNSSTASTAQIDYISATVTWAEDISADAGAIPGSVSLGETGEKAASGAAGSITAAPSLVETGCKSLSAPAGSLAPVVTMAASGGSGTEAHSGSGAMPLTASLVATGGKAVAGVGSLPTSPSLTASGLRGSSGAGMLNASASLVGTGVKDAAGAGTLTLSASMAAAGSAGAPEQHSGSGLLALAAALSAAGAKGTPGGIGPLGLTAIFALGGATGRSTAGELSLAAILTASGGPSAPLIGGPPPPIGGAFSLRPARGMAIHLKPGS